MYRKYMDKEQKVAFDYFIENDFKATLVENNENFLIFDWKRSDGSGNLSTRYILDKKRGSLIISGDSGDCIASWFNGTSIKNMENYVNSIGYFMEKFQTSSDEYSYKYDDIVEDFEYIRNEIENNIFEYIKDQFNLTDADCKDFPKDISGFFNAAEEASIDDNMLNYGYILDYDGYDLEELLENLRDWALERNGDYMPAFDDSLDKFVQDFYCNDCWWDTPLEDCGRRISQRVYLWAVGFQMGVSQLGFLD